MDGSFQVIWETTNTLITCCSCLLRKGAHSSHRFHTRAAFAMMFVSSNSSTFFSIWEKRRIFDLFSIFIVIGSYSAAGPTQRRASSLTARRTGSGHTAQYCSLVGSRCLHVKTSDHMSSRSKKCHGKCRCVTRKYFPAETTKVT